MRQHGLVVSGTRLAGRRRGMQGRAIEPADTDACERWRTGTRAATRCTAILRCMPGLAGQGTGWRAVVCSQHTGTCRLFVASMVQ